MNGVDAAGRLMSSEVFAPDRLGDAIARLYARHAELLPDGPERERAAMMARAVTTMLTRSTEHRLEDVSTPDIAAVDHRSVGMGAVTGSDLWQRWRAASDELMQDPRFASRTFSRSAPTDPAADDGGGDRPRERRHVREQHLDSLDLRPRRPSEPHRALRRRPRSRGAGAL